jgi:hypothetical protein
MSPAFVSNSRRFGHPVRSARCRSAPRSYRIVRVSATILVDQGDRPQARMISLGFFCLSPSAPRPVVERLLFTTRTVMGMKAWSLPHSSEHWPK